MMSWSSFSQTATDSTKIQLTKPIAKLVVKDLVQYDGLSLEIKTLNELIAETNNKLTVQTDLVANLKAQVLNYESIVFSKEEQINTAQAATESLQKALKKERRAKKLYQVGSAIGGGAILLLLVQ